jgi:cellulose synthase/poly-beta-1,6-N-acetylglucosamine synthase-like glycosyltransferase
MKITFGCIVFNILETLPENMFEYCIQNIYEYAHEIIIVEGATKAISHYWDGDTSTFTSNGRSTDGTIEYLYKLQEKYPKIKIIIGDGFWNGKTEMCNAYASIATGDYIWQLDSDEFYHENDIIKIIRLLDLQNPDSVHFYANHFFGGFNYVIDERCSTSWGK